MKAIRFFPLPAFIFMFLLLHTKSAYAQKDSIKGDTIKKEYNQDQNDFYLKRREKYDYLTRAKIEELSMFKVYLSYSSIALQESTTGPSIGYERKLAPDFSLFGEVGVCVPLFNTYSILPPFVDASIACRYYYNMREKIWEGKSANNLSANYFSFQISNNYYVRNFPLLGALYGIQRRIGRLCFFDINGGVVFADYGPSGILGPNLILNAKFGFGL